jgi:hypothetical protein
MAAWAYDRGTRWISVISGVWSPDKKTGHKVGHGSLEPLRNNLAFNIDFVTAPYAAPINSLAMLYFLQRFGGVTIIRRIDCS